MAKLPTHVRLWNKLEKDLSPLNDNNQQARKIYNYITRYFKPKKK